MYAALQLPITVGSHEGELAQEITEFQKNRRMEMESGMEYEYEPVFKSLIWRVKRGYDCMKPEDWIFRSPIRNTQMEYIVIIVSSVYINIG